MSRVSLFLSIAIGLIAIACYTDLLVGGVQIPSVENFPSSSQQQTVDPNADDIEEDENDPFITTRKGKLRPNYVVGSNSDEEDDSWSDIAPASKPLSRKKRCGYDDDGDANRARKAWKRGVNKARKVQKTSKSKKSKKSKTTIVTRKVIQNGQVVSETTETVQHPTKQQVVQQQQPVVIQHQQPVQTVVHQTQPVVHQQTQSHPIMQSQPVVQPTVPVAQQPVQQTHQAMPSISVQGSVKVN